MIMKWRREGDSNPRTEYSLASLRQTLPLFASFCWFLFAKAYKVIQVACLYKQPKSPFFWIKFRDATGKIKRQSTKLRHANPVDVRNAKQLCARKTLEEYNQGLPMQDTDRWEVWTTGFLNTRYKHSPVTCERYLGIWSTLAMFLKEFAIDTPRQFARRHCFDYMTWRGKPNKRIGKYKACHNTALLELKVLRLIIQEAIERELCPGNPIIKLGIKREKPRRIKPEFSDDTIEFIRKNIRELPRPGDREFFSNSFEIARYQGCRLKETSLNPQADVEIIGGAGTIRFHAKGENEFTTLLHPKLIPLFERLKREGRTDTWKTPAGCVRQLAASKWFRFLRDIGLKKTFVGACFHSLRVTVLTRMARNNVSISKAKGYVGHASTTIHETYQRLKPGDVSECAHAVG